MTLVFFAPFPEHKDAQALNDLKLFYIHFNLAKSDEPGKSPKEIFNSMDPKIKENIILINDSAWIPEYSNIMIAYSNSILPKAVSLNSFGLPFYAIRGWPDHPISERRGTLYSDGSIKIIKEKEFQHMIKSNHAGSTNSPSPSGRP